MRYPAVVLVVGLVASVASATTPGLVFHATYDGTVAASSGLEPLRVEGELSHVNAPVGQGVLLSEGSWLAYRAAGYLDKSAGTVAFWVQPQWHGNDGKRHSLFSDSAPTHTPAFNSFHLFKTPSATLQFTVGGLAEHSVSTTVADWTAGEWHHVAVTWDSRQGIALYVDGQEAGGQQLSYDPQQWPAFHVGADYDGSVTAAAAFSDFQLYDRRLRADQVAARSQRLSLSLAEIIEIAGPASVRAGQDISVQMRALAAETLSRSHAVLLSLGGMPIARIMPHPEPPTWPDGEAVQLDPVTVRVPDYLPLAVGEHSLSAVLEGTVSVLGTEPPIVPVAVTSPAWLAPMPAYDLREGQVYAAGRPWPGDGSGVGFVYDGQFYAGDEAGRAMAARLYETGQIRDALRCVLLDETPADEQDAAEGYLLKNRALDDEKRRTAHLLVVDVDGVTAAGPVGVQVRAAGERRPDEHLLLWATVDPGPRRQVREAFMFYPQGDACRVRLTTLAGPKRGEPAPGTRSVAVYHLLDYPVVNVTELPDPPLRRSLALMPVHTQQIYASFGSADRDTMQRAASLRSMMHYMQFVGFDGLVLHSGGNMHSYYDGGMLPNAWRWDLLDDLLPLAAAAGVDVVPVVPPLSGFDRLFTLTPESFLVDIHGETVRDQAGNRCPNPFRHEVQRQLLVFLDELSARTEGFDCVPALGISVDGEVGTGLVSAGGEQTADRVGYSEWDLQQFQAASGIALDTRGGGSLAAYYLLRNSPEHWEQWLDFRCRQTHDLWTKCRDLVVSRNRRRNLYVDSRLPVPPVDSQHSELRLLRHHGYDPKLLAEERGIHLAARFGGEYGNQARSGFATAEGNALQIEAGDLPGGREAMVPLLQAMMNGNPYWLTVRSSLDAKTGREPALRAFARAYRALPAVPARPFEGDVWPRRDGIWVRAFDDYVAVINLTDKPQQVRLTFSRPLPYNTRVLDMTSGQRTRITRIGRSTVRVMVDTQAYEMRTLKVIEPMPRTGPGARMLPPGAQP